MLLRFGVSGFASIRDYQEISLVTPIKKVREKNFAKPYNMMTLAQLKRSVFPVAAVYGANAAGKTNLLHGLVQLIIAVRSAHQNRGMLAMWQPFLLSPSESLAPTRYDCDVMVDDIRHHYGFRFDGELVLEEWLYIYPNYPRKQILFHRNVEEEIPFYFGPALKGPNKFIQSLTRHDSLFLSAAGMNNHPKLFSLFNYISGSLRWALNMGGRGKLNLEQSEKIPEMLDKVLEFVREADTGVVNFCMEEEKDPEVREWIIKQFKRENPHLFVEGKSDPEITMEAKTFALEHCGEEGKRIKLPYERESHGTQAMVGLGIKVITALEYGQVLIVDELESGLHPFNVRRLVEVFQDPKKNTKGAQLIFSTHHAGLLDILHPASVWLCEKAPGGNSEFYPLSSFKIRHEDNMERGYLKGRYGAIPYVGDLERLWTGSTDNA